MKSSTVFLAFSASVATEGFHISSANRRHSIVAFSTSVSDATTTPTTQEIQTLFAALADTTLLSDPSGGSCCRNKCSGCKYLDPPSGNFAYNEHTDGSGWLAPYVKVDFGDRVESSKWSDVLFPFQGIPGSSFTQPPKDVEKDQLASMLETSDDISPLAWQSLWKVLSPGSGADYSKLSSKDVTSAIQEMEGSTNDLGGAVDYATFETNMNNAANQILQN
mmetsp:Transcript_18588/g.25791  ORF Transcript_18588/g.25791 Transcript_18588/m.25791 type:complete len:220 (+) Transcript_18588:77-736(+)